MGWLELLPLLKRLLPLLDRLAPALEALMAGRFSGKAEAERVSAAAIAEVTRSHGSLLQAMEEQRAQGLVLAGEIRQLQTSTDAIAASLGERTHAMEDATLRLDALERQNTSLLHLIRTGLAVLLLLLIAVLILLFVLLRRHA